MNPLVSIAKPLGVTLPLRASRTPETQSGDSEIRALSSTHWLYFSRRHRGAAVLALHFLGRLADAGKYVHWHRENQGSVLFDSDFSQCLEIAELDADRFLGQQARCVY